MKNIWQKNCEKSKKKVGWIDLNQAKYEDYQKIGFMCGLEVHQQLKTDKKLFCRCKAGHYHNFNDYDAEIVRHMRPTLSELGEYDGTALMEFKTKKEITYRINNKTSCTYEMDDTPPFPINKQALECAIKIANLSKTNLVGELHITRKQYLDGSIPTGFQRTAIIGIEGEIPISNKKIRLIQFSIEEDSCREVSDIGHKRVYFADRLGMPLIETVTYPDMLTPFEAAEACQNIRFIARSTNNVRTGIGAARQDVNVSVTGGTRIEIKGVAHIKWIPLLTHNEAFRQVALLEIKKTLNERVNNIKKWKINAQELFTEEWKHISFLNRAIADNCKIYAVNLPKFKEILSHFTQPCKIFADEISDRLKVIACLEKPNLIHSEELIPSLKPNDWKRIAEILKANEDDAQLVFIAPESDVKTALETIEERALLAFEGIPNETRKSIPDGTTIFERVLPGPDRMYPDTDSKPISITQDFIDKACQDSPPDLSFRFDQLKEWKVPNEAYTYILKNNLMPLIEKISNDFNLSHKKISLIFAQNIKNLAGHIKEKFDFNLIYDLIKFLQHRDIEFDLIYKMLPVLSQNQHISFESILTLISFEKYRNDFIINQIDILSDMYDNFPKKSADQDAAKIRWVMGKINHIAIGNISLAELKSIVTKKIRKGE
ncbi:MAG: Glu-tRNA(Gln) amidotransferase subunit GatE [Candidatus Cloacimonetes bacterium]|nr:Glu-tRNA(Gln) amidotransferase subunit GatE [Candidatus Cloacimonadota bacterium]